MYSALKDRVVVHTLAYRGPSTHAQTEGGGKEFTKHGSADRQTKLVCRSAELLSLGSEAQAAPDET
jgi:hypothetical protein